MIISECLVKENCQWGRLEAMGSKAAGQICCTQLNAVAEDYTIKPEQWRTKTNK